MKDEITTIWNSTSIRTVSYYISATGNTKSETMCEKGVLMVIITADASIRQLREYSVFLKSHVFIIQSLIMYKCLLSIFSKA